MDKSTLPGRLPLRPEKKYTRLEGLFYAISWAVILGLPVVTQLYEVYSGQLASFRWGRMTHGYTVIGSIFALFLVNNFVLLPRLFWKGRRWLYVAAVAAAVAALWLVLPRPPHPGPPPELPHHLHDQSLRIDMFHLTTVILGLSVVVVNFSIKLYIHSMRRDLALLDIRNEQIASELESLKYQISPHFLMNTLNNIQSLIETDPPRACQTLQGLSRMMRYLLYDNGRGHDVELKKEIGFLKNFIALMKIRYPDNVTVSTSLPEHTEGISIPPLLLIPFVENAFKHGVSYSAPSAITIAMETDGRRLTFACTNTVAPRRETAERPGAERRPGTGGIGIANVKRRLQLLFPGDYTLDISSHDGLYRVALDIPCSTSSAKTT